MISVTLSNAVLLSMSPLLINGETEVSGTQSHCVILVLPWFIQMAFVAGVCLYSKLPASMDQVLNKASL